MIKTRTDLACRCQLNPGLMGGPEITCSRFRYRFGVARALFIKVNAEPDDLKALVKACEEAIAHLRQITEETNDRLTLLALHGQPDSESPPTPPIDQQASSSIPEVEPGSGREDDA